MGAPAECGTLVIGIAPCHTTTDRLPHTSCAIGGRGGAEKCPHYWDATYFAAQLLTVAEADNNRTPEDAQ